MCCVHCEHIPRLAHEQCTMNSFRLIELNNKWKGCSNKIFGEQQKLTKHSNENVEVQGQLSLEIVYDLIKFPYESGSFAFVHANTAYAYLGRAQGHKHRTQKLNETIHTVHLLESLEARTGSFQTCAIYSEMVRSPDCRFIRIIFILLYIMEHFFTQP